MKNKGIIIIMIILLIIIIIGLISILVLALNGSLNKIFFRNGGKKSSDIIFDEKYKMSEVENLEILSTAGDITFKESSDENIRVVVYGQNSRDVKASLNNEKLEINYKLQKKNWFSIKFYLNDIIVYIPKDYANEINIDSEYGDCNFIDLEKATISIKSDCGDINIGDVANTEIKCSYGDIEIRDILNRCMIKSDCGDIEIDRLQIKENSEIDSSYGDIEIKQINDIYVDAKSSLGDVKVNNNNRYSDITLLIKNSCGDIKVGK